MKHLTESTTFMPGLRDLVPALLPGAAIGLLFVLRTAKEDRMLREELPGYPEYAQRIRYRLVPGIW